MHINSEIEKTISDGKPVVALESSVITQGLPRPENLDTARAMEAAVRDEGATPATIAVCSGVPTIGLTEEQLVQLAERDDVIKASRRDLGYAAAKKKSAGTTVAATLTLAHRAGIHVFATGGIGGVHRDADRTRDVSADLLELSRTPVAVVCAGAKSILDVPRTLEQLESYSVPVVGFDTDEFPAFTLRTSGERLSARVDSIAEAASLAAAHWSLGGAGVIFALPIEEDDALDPQQFASALHQAELTAQRQNIRGKDLTPFLLAQLADSTGGESLRANQALLIANARLAAKIAAALCRHCNSDAPKIQ